MPGAGAPASPATAWRGSSALSLTSEIQPEAVIYFPTGTSMININPFTAARTRLFFEDFGA